LELALTFIKLLHTVVWATLAACVFALQWASWTRRFRPALWLSAIILGECLVLGVNGGRCPLTNLAARYTADRSANFDIYLPLWLARNNKLIFGTLFVLGEVITLFQWRFTKKR
jgi:hypothetical protein